MEGKPIVQKDEEMGNIRGMSRDMKGRFRMYKPNLKLIQR